MSLEGYTPDTEEIPVIGKGKKKYVIVVRGLNLEDMSAILANRLHEAEAAVALFQAAKSDIYNRAGWDAFAITLVKEAPGLVAEVISTVAGEPDKVAVYAKLPFSVSVSCLTHILRLSVEEAGGLKNLLTALGALVKGMLPEDARAALESYLNSAEPNSNDSTGATVLQ